MILETERLILREMDMNDYDALYAILTDADISQYYPYIFDEKKVREWIRRNRERYQENGFGLWAVCLKDSGVIIGDCGLTLQCIDGKILPEIGYHIRKDHQRKGYAKEAAAAVRDWAFQNTAYPALYSYCQKANIASVRTAEAIGMHLEKEYPDSENGIISVSVIDRPIRHQQMQFLFASDSFKGSLTSEQTIRLLTKAAREVFPDCNCIGVPVADGGEGTVHSVVSAAGGTIVTAEVHDPLMQKIPASYGMIENHKAIIEMAAASGLPLVPEKNRNPMNTTSFGTGELIRDALDRGCRDIAIAIGGSATNDGGMGCMRALGVRFLTAEGRELCGFGRELSEIAWIDTDGLDSRLSECHITVMCDVSNPLCGKNGATYTFARQKGATDGIILQLENGMCRYRDVIRSQYGIDCDTIEGAGAAGGLGAALCVFLNGTMQSGIETVLQLIDFDQKLKDIGLVITGEGCTDHQSICGKVMQGVGRHAMKKGIPCIGLSGSLGEGAEKILDHGISSLHCIVNAPMSLAYAMNHAEQLYYEAALRMFRTVKVGMTIHQKEGCEND